MRSKAPILVILKRAGALLLAAASACALSVVSFAASDTPSDGVVVSVTVDRDSGITPFGVFSGVNGMDNQSYSITPLYKDWSEAWQYRWSQWTTSASLFGFKSFSAYITIPVNISVPRSSKTTLFIPGFYIVANGILSSSADVPFSNVTFQNDKGDIQTVNLIPSITDTNSIIAFDDTSVELGEGSWTVTNIILRCRISPTVFTSANGYFGLSGFEFSMTTSLSVSDFISQQTQDIIKNDVLPAVNNMNQSINDVNSSVEDVNQSVQAVEQAVKQGNQNIKDLTKSVNDSFSQTNEKLDNLPNKIGDEFDVSLESAADKEKEEAESTGNKYVNDLLDSVDIDSASWLTAFTSLTNVLTSTSTDCTITFPALSLPSLSLSGESFGGSSLSEEKEIDLTSAYNEYIPSLIRNILSFFMTAAIALFLFHEVSDFILFCLGVGNNNE